MEGKDDCFTGKLVYRVPLDGELTAEYGLSADIEFSQGTMFDSAGNEVEIPTCKRCLGAKTMVMGNEAYTWLCLACHGTVVGDYGQ